MKKRFLESVMVALAVILLAGCPKPSTQQMDTVITLSKIPGVTAPVTGATPASSLDTSQYTGTISWSPTIAGSFAANTVYTATITLTAKAGYTLNDVAADFFTVEGTTSDTKPVNSGVVTAVFPSTGDGSYTSANIGTLRYIPAGRFQRDSEANNISVISHPYRMSQHEITRTQFLAIMGADPSNSTYSSGTSDPVQMVNWYHAIAFCNKLSLAEGLTPVYSVIVSGTPVNWSTLTYASIPTSNNMDWDAATATWGNNGYRLPTTMEWMWAAMGATSDATAVWIDGVNTNGYAKAFAGSDGSNELVDYAWYDYNSYNVSITSSKSRPVGTKAANELGLHDMSGNVWEWNWDWWTINFPAGTLTDFTGVVSGTLRILRGGSWILHGPGCSVANRVAIDPYYRGDRNGFRVVRP